MMEAEVGKGKIIWVCAPFENTSLTQPRKVFTSFVKKYVPEMRFASDDTPYVVEYQLWEDEEGKYLSAINLQYADEVLPVFDFNICIRTEKPAKITRVSDGRKWALSIQTASLFCTLTDLTFTKCSIFRYNCDSCSVSAKGEKQWKTKDSSIWQLCN